MEYVAGFLHDEERIALVRKNRPEWQNGLLNGIGGKIEDYEHHPEDAMVREFDEETGVFIEGWEHFLTLRGTRSLIYCFALFDTEGWLDKVRTAEDEEIVVVPISSISRQLTVPNVQWIVPLMLQRGNYHPVTVEFHDGTRGSK